MVHGKMILLVFKNLGRYRSENNYFDSPTKLFSDLAKFLDISVKSFFSCV